MQFNICRNLIFFACEYVFLLLYYRRHHRPFTKYYKHMYIYFVLVQTIYSSPKTNNKKVIISNFLDSKIIKIKQKITLE